MKREEVKKDNNFKNLHQVDRKRRFGEITKINPNIPDTNMNQNLLVNSGMIQEIPQRKILVIQKNYLPSSSILTSSKELEEILNYVDLCKNKEDLKTFLKAKIPNFLSKSNILNLFF